MIAGIGFGTFSALIGVAAGSLALALGVSPYSGLFFFLLSAVPSAFFAWLVMLARPADPQNRQGGLEWYPIGRIVAWVAGAAAAVVTATIPAFGLDLDSYRSNLKEMLRRMITPSEGGVSALPDGVDIEAMLDFFAIVLPIGGALLWMLSQLANLWLAARIVAMSGRLNRPWPAFSQIDYPRIVPLIFIAAVMLSFLPGMVGFVAGLVSTTYAAAFVLLGLAVLHVITEGNQARPFILGTTYLMLVLLAWIAIILAALGLGESFLRLRARKKGAAPPSKT